MDLFYFNVLCLMFNVLFYFNVFFNFFRCRESVYSKLANGMPFKQLKVWIKSAQSAEKTFAEKSLTLQQYEKQVQKYVQLHNYGKEFIMDILGNAIFSPNVVAVGGGMPPPPPVGGYVPNIGWGDPMTISAAFVSPPAGLWMPTSLYHHHSFPLSSQSSNATENLSQAKDTLSKLCEHLQTSAASAMLVSSPMNVGASSQDNSVLVDLGEKRNFFHYFLAMHAHLFHFFFCYFFH